MKKSIKLYSLIKERTLKVSISFLFLLIFIFGCVSNQLKIQGQIFSKGNHPFTFLVIESDDGKVYEIVDKKGVYRNYQQKRVLLKARVLNKSESSMILPTIEVLEIKDLSKF